MSPIPWASFSQRPHKFVEWFHSVKGKDVLWIDPYPTRFPLVSDFRRLETPRKAENQRIPTWIKVIHPRALPIEPLPGSGLLNGLRWRSVLNEANDFSRKESTLLAIGKPSVLALIILNRLKNIPSVYDAMDDFPAFYAVLSRMAMKWRECKVVSKVTHVLVSSTALQRRWSQVRLDIQLVPNGLDAEIIPVFKRLDSKYSNRVFGYVGTIGPWFDWDWVIALAKARPEDVVRLIGPVFVPATNAVLPKNIEILPPCNHEEALRAMQDFNIGLIPFKQNVLTKSVDPIKYYEYRALGLPIISKDFGEMTFRGKEKGVFVSQSGTDINQFVEKALLFKSNSDEIKEFIRKNSWESRFNGAKIC